MEIIKKTRENKDFGIFARYTFKIKVCFKNLSFRSLLTKKVKKVKK